VASHTRPYHAIHHLHVHTRPDPDYRASSQQREQEEAISAFRTPQGSGIPSDNLYRRAGQQQHSTREEEGATQSSAVPQGSRIAAGGNLQVCAHRHRHRRQRSSQ